MGQLQTALTISTLMVGVALTLMSASNFEDADNMNGLYAGEYSEKQMGRWVSTPKAHKYQQHSVNSAMFAFSASGMEFFLAMMLLFSLELAELHPDDYDSAEIWRDTFKPLLRLSKILEGVAYWCAAFSTSCLWYIKSRPDSMNSVVFPLFGIAMLLHPIFVIAVRHCHILSQQKVQDERSSSKITVQPAPDPGFASMEQLLKHIGVDEQYGSLAAVDLKDFRALAHTDAVACLHELSIAGVKQGHRIKIYNLLKDTSC